MKKLALLMALPLLTAPLAGCLSFGGKPPKTLLTLTPCGYAVFSPEGVIHWCGVPSLIHGVMPPWRCNVARFSE